MHCLRKLRYFSTGLRIDEIVCPSGTVFNNIKPFQIIANCSRSLKIFIILNPPKTYLKPIFFARNVTLLDLIAILYLTLQLQNNPFHLTAILNLYFELLGS